MSGEKYLVKYHNDFNTVHFEKKISRFSTNELNFLFFLVNKIREEQPIKSDEKHGNLFQVTYKELKKLINWDDSNKRFDSMLNIFADKLHTLFFIGRAQEDNNNLGIKKGAKIRMQFVTLSVDDPKNQVFSFWLSDDASYIVKRIDSQYTKFWLNDFVIFKSEYTKNIYRHLEQWEEWRKFGVKEFSKDQLISMLNVPESTQTTSNFNNRVLSPIKKELGQFFTDFSIVPIKTGKKITSYQFRKRVEDASTISDIKAKKTVSKYKKSKRQETLPYWLKEGAGSDQPKLENTDNQDQLREKMKQVFDQKEN